jgi:hypothetical protein
MYLNLTDVFDIGCNIDCNSDYLIDNFDWYDFCYNHIDYYYDDDNCVEDYDFSIYEKKDLNILKSYLTNCIEFPNNGDIQKCLDLFKVRNISELKDNYLKELSLFRVTDNVEEIVATIKNCCNFNVERLKKSVVDTIIEIRQPQSHWL